MCHIVLDNYSKVALLNFVFNMTFIKQVFLSFDLHYKIHKMVYACCFLWIWHCKSESTAKEKYISWQDVHWLRRSIFPAKEVRINLMIIIIMIIIAFFFFFCGQSAVLRPSVHMLPGIGWCTVPHSLLVVDSSCSHNWCLFPPDETVLEDVVECLSRFFAIAEGRVLDANSLQVRSQATVSCSQPEYIGLLMSC